MLYEYNISHEIRYMELNFNEISLFVQRQGDLVEI